MVTIIEIIKAVTTTLEAVFPDVEVVIMDISKGYPRACLYVDVDSGSDSTVGGYLEQTHTLTIYYFAEEIEKGFLDLLKARNKFSEMLGEPINVVDDFYIQPNNIAYEMNHLDMALKVSFDVQTVQVPEEIDAEIIETIEINIKKE